MLGWGGKNWSNGGNAWVIPATWYYYGDELYELRWAKYVAKIGEVMLSKVLDGELLQYIDLETEALIILK